MKNYFLILLAIFCTAVSFPAYAQTVVIEDSACRALVRHQPAADATYQPGVDVHGNPVVEADINANPVKVPETIRFNITVDVAKHAGLNVPAGTEMQAVMGTVEIQPDGRMTFNGEPMEGQSEAALYALCAEKKHKKHQKPVLQKQPDIIYNR